MFDAPSYTTTCLDEHIIFSRYVGDHIAPDHYWRFQPILITDTSGRRVQAWLRRWGGDRTHSLSALGASLIEAGRINPATAIF